jgi:predicted neutral ceramidase superfamily lipid hydrolase
MISAISNQHLALTFGTASIVAVFVAGFLTWKQPANPAVFFAVAPLSAWVLAMWLGEVVRMFRPVAFCREQATLINASLGHSSRPAIRWEAWRDEDPNRTLVWTYVSVVTVLSGAYAAGVALGLVTAEWSAVTTVLVAAAFGAGLVVTWAGVFRVFKRWSNPTSTVGMPTKVARWAPRRSRETSGEAEYPNTRGD